MRARTERTDGWPVRAVKTIRHTINKGQNSIILGNTENGNYQANGFRSDEEILFSYIHSKEAFLVWNVNVLRSLGLQNADCGVNGKRTIENGIQSNEIKYIYKKHKDGYEKIVLVGKDALFEFCSHYEEYLFPNEEDVKTGESILFASIIGDYQIIDSNSININSELIRSRDLVSRARRNPKFRKEVLQKYNYTCIVCGTMEEKILEAAHIRAVSENGSDDVKNGVCLCANHHRLFDSDELRICDNGTFICTSIEAKKMAWYKEAEQRQFRLFLPNLELKDE